MVVINIKNYKCFAVANLLHIVVILVKQSTKNLMKTVVQIEFNLSNKIKSLLCMNHLVEV